MVFSKKLEDHPNHLCNIFERCRKYGISLNPKKCIFGVSEGKFLGHVISEKGISIDSNRVEALLKLQTPESKKEMRSFLEKINFVCKFITKFTKIVKPLNDMMKKEAKIEWSQEAKDTFNQIKQSIVEAPVLTIQDYTLLFYIHYFASLQSCSTVLMQRKDGDEKPIAFMSSPFKNAKERYIALEKQLTLHPQKQNLCYSARSGSEIATDAK
ncbi:uncharacterized mitochondrial protein AtMg00860-like [Cryptomeria japonica]|uniref:uncharacterized mitochondrial protein AtMg00860-like n=1 Tax=Cryptomeria japonica TaxID=3369 RepID=UPI0025AD6C46|nr:uncharacterized mitochondrial protein AtMg00860-like [Cryptomeria japonica]